MNETKLNISGHQMEVGSALQTHCEGKVEELKASHFEHVTSVDVTFKHERHRHLAAVHIHANGINMQVTGEGQDFYLAADDAFKTLGRRLEKYKGRLNKHRNRRAKIKEMEQMEQLPVFKATYHMLEEKSLEDAPEDVFAEYSPKIVHEVVQEIKTMSVDEAVMEMDLLHTNFHIFRNPKSGRVNLVYRENEDGPIGWIEPAEGPSADAESAA